MVILIDILTIIISLVITYALYWIYKKITIIRFINKIKKAIGIGDKEKAEKMKEYALQKQPKKMNSLFNKYGINP
jgi:hypothetical protein